MDECLLFLTRHVKNKQQHLLCIKVGAGTPQNLLLCVSVPEAEDVLRAAVP